MTKEEQVRRLFNIIYILGIFTGMALIYSIYIDYPLALEIVKNDIYIIVFPIAYLVILFAISRILRERSGQIAGSKIQTAGYLFTLIGVIIAILQIDNDSFSIENLIPPIGMALVTSLFGWFLGSFVSTYEPNGSSFMEEDRGSLIDYLEDQKKFFSELKSIQNEYIRSISKGAREFEALRNNITPIKEALDGMKDLANYLSSKDVIESAKSLPLGIKELNYNLKKASKNAETTAKLLTGIDDLVEGYKKLMEHITASK